MPQQQHVKMTTADAKAIVADKRWSNLENCVSATWQVCGSDAEQLAEECGERLNNAGRLETCLDADRMSTNCGKDGEAADEFVTELCNKYGYPAVAKLIGKHVKL